MALILIFLIAQTWVIVFPAKRYGLFRIFGIRFSPTHLFERVIMFDTRSGIWDY